VVVFVAIVWCSLRRDGEGGGVREGSDGGVDFACLFEVRDQEEDDDDDDGDGDAVEETDPTDTTLLLLLLLLLFASMVDVMVP